MNVLGVRIGSPWLWPLLGLGLTLGLLGFALTEPRYYALNTPLFVWVHRLPLGPEGLWQNITFLGDKWLLFSLLIFWWRQYKGVFWEVLVIALVLGAVLLVLKQGFGRLRPEQVLGGSRCKLWAMPFRILPFLLAMP